MQRFGESIYVEPIRTTWSGRGGTGGRGSRLRRLRVEAVIFDAKDRPCVDCGIRLPAPCMELDHVRGQKEFDVSRSRGDKRTGKGYATLPEIRAEIAKCEVRCPNCHRLRHYRERFAQMASHQMKLAV